MKEFAFVNAPTLDSAVALLGELGEKAYVVAGGTNVMVDIRVGKRNGRTLVNIRDIGALKGISLQNDEMRVGALATLSQIAASELLKEKAPCLYMAANVFADPTTRNSATIAGNCAGASPAADTAPSLLALNAIAHIVSAKGERQLNMNEFFAGVNRTHLQPGELITHFTFKPSKSGFIKLGIRNSMAISIVTAAAALELAGDVVTTCRVALGSVAPTPVRAKSVEAALTGQRLTEELLAHAAERVREDISPIDDVRATGAYRREVAPVCVKRAVKLAAYGECR
ncbi:MAG: xanthine dehydrogenase family protein subunit M [Christensenellaceae bacterium]|jgi:carbon-monoxide dehydrogenase medium subunit|nr:xanthine dehydrogenase family protein subunit M [Christensenellaceae bacterium]